MDRLCGREVWVEPDLIAGLEVRDLRDGEGCAGAGDADIDPGASEVKARLSAGQGGGGGDEQGGSETMRQTSHGASLDACGPGNARKGEGGGLVPDTTLAPPLVYLLVQSLGSIGVRSGH